VCEVLCSDVLCCVLFCAHMLLTTAKRCVDRVWGCSSPGAGDQLLTALQLALVMETGFGAGSGLLVIICVWMLAVGCSLAVVCALLTDASSCVCLNPYLNCFALRATPLCVYMSSAGVLAHRHLPLCMIADMHHCV
jgi:hypothetical protein